MKDYVTLTDGEVDQIQYHFFRGCYHDEELLRLFDTIRRQREVLRQLFDRYKKQPFRRHAEAEPITNSELEYLKELVCMDEKED